MRGRQELAAEGRRRCTRKQSDVDPSHPRLSSAAARYGVWSRRAAGAAQLPVPVGLLSSASPPRATTCTTARSAFSPVQSTDLVPLASSPGRLKKRAFDETLSRGPNTTPQPAPRQNRRRSGSSPLPIPPLRAGGDNRGSAWRSRSHLQMFLCTLRSAERASLLSGEHGRMSHAA